ERKHVLAVKVLMQGVVIVGAVAQKERRWFGLSRLMAALEEGAVLLREADFDAHRLVPAVGDFGQRRIKGLPQLLDDRRQGISEIAIFASAVTVTRHHNSAPEERIVLVRGHEFFAFLGTKNRTDYQASIAVQFDVKCVPIQG